MLPLRLRLSFLPSWDCRLKVIHTLLKHSRPWFLLGRQETQGEELLATHHIVLSLSTSSTPDRGIQGLHCSSEMVISPFLVDTVSVAV